MIEVDIPSIDPMQHEPKIFLGMTSRQCICIVPGVAIGGLLYMLFASIKPDLGMFGAMIGLCPAILMGWYKPYNMNFEDYVKLLYFNNVICTHQRIYKTDSENEVKAPTMKERQAIESTNKKLELEKRKQKNKKNNKKGA